MRISETGSAALALTILSNYSHIAPADGEPGRVVWQRIPTVPLDPKSSRKREER